MSLRTSQVSTLLASLALSALVLGACGLVKGQQALELLELKTTLEVAASKIQALESEVATAKAKNEALAQSAAAANEEAAEYRDRYERLRGLLEGLGIAAMENAGDELQNRLLAALSDLRIAEQQRLMLSEQLMKLAEASVAFASTVAEPDPETATRLNDALARSEGLLAASPRRVEEMEARDLTDTRVVSMKPDLGIAILGVGSRDGVKPGMPFQIFREDKPIAKVLVTDVRATVSGAVVQESANPEDPIQVGDRGVADTSRSF
jgi:outer membrane murein-binding lipoprotein Lpp